jgi:hypothetical protein
MELMELMMVLLLLLLPLPATILLPLYCRRVLVLILADDDRLLLPLATVVGVLGRWGEKILFILLLLLELLLVLLLLFFLLLLLLLLPLLLLELVVGDANQLNGEMGIRLLLLDRRDEEDTTCFGAVVDDVGVETRGRSSISSSSLSER